MIDATVRATAGRDVLVEDGRLELVRNPAAQDKYADTVVASLPLASHVGAARGDDPE